LRIQTFEDTFGTQLRIRKPQEVTAMSAVSINGTAVTSSFGPVSGLRAVPPLPANARVRLRLTRRGRAVLSAVVALPLVAGALVFALNGGGAVATGEQTHTSFQYATVQAGDSLWSVAERVAPNSDPRDVIADIVSLNGLESAVVSPGQQLAVPAKYAG
jgi:hypothetical protein